MTKIAPTSFPQQGLWLLSQLRPQSVAYHVALHLSLEGPLQEDVLVQCLVAISQRHEILRTLFESKEGDPVQVIFSDSSFRPEVLDLRQDPAPSDSLARIHSDRAHQHFSLSSGPLWRVTLTRLRKDAWDLLLVVHHLLWDAGSTDMFIQDLLALYRARVSGEPDGLPPLACQYADFAEQQRVNAQSPVFETHASFWKEELRGAPPSLALPTDHPGRTSLLDPGASLGFRIPQPLGDALGVLARTQDASLFMILLAALEALLFRETRQEDFVVGCPMSLRMDPAFKPLIGFFLNTVPMRAQVSGSMRFREHLDRVRDRCLSVYPHRECPFEKLVEVLRPQRDPSQHPFFQVLFAFLGRQTRQFEVQGMRVRMQPLNTRTSKFDLTLHLDRDPEGLDGRWEHSATLFEPETIRRMAGHFENLLTGIVQDPDSSLDHLPLLSDSERRQILVDWIPEPSPLPTERTVHAFLETQVAKTPAAVAILDHGQEVSYEDLNSRANAWAALLKRRGVGPEVLVGICLPRGIDACVAVLGILKAQGAYLPLDPGWPKERIKRLCEESRLSLILSHSDGTVCLPARPVEILLIDTQGFPGPFPPPVLSPEAWPENPLAYVLFTSGSSGTPKGVAMPHKGLVNLIHWQRQSSMAKAGTRTLQFAPLGFDVSFQEMFSTWASAGTLVLVNEQERSDFNELLNLILREKVERLFLPAVALSVLAETSLSRGITPRSLREIIVAGEPLRITRVLVTWFQGMPECDLINQYGPTETHVVSEYRLKGDPKDWPRLPPVGRPIANTRLYVLDPAMQPVPVGVPGELHIGGISLARGYLYRPDLTSERFVNDPFSPGPSDSEHRLYKSGDLCRLRSDGNIEFLGRTDRQIKVRGYRVEPAEIEAVLMDLPGVAEAVVTSSASTSDEDVGSGDLTLVAHVSLNPGYSIEPSELKRLARERLPSFMVPASIRILDHLPMTPSGKKDPRALSGEPAWSPPHREVVAPQDEMERQMVRLWEELFNIRPIGITDDFFDLGGHSLLAARLIARLRNDLKLDIPLAALFEAPTIEALRRRIAGGPQPSERSVLVCLQSQGRLPAFFCCHGGGGEVMDFHELARQLGQERPFYGIRMHGWEGDEPNDTTIEAMAQRYVPAIREVQPSGPYLLGGFCVGASVALEMAQILSGLKECVALLVLLEGENPGVSNPGLLQRMLNHWMDMKDKSWPIRQQLLHGIWSRNWLRLRRSVLGLSVAQMPVETKGIHFMDVCIRARRQYMARPYSGPAILFRSQDIVGRGDMGWSAVLGAGLDICDVPGTHHGVLEMPHVATLAGKLKMRIDKSLVTNSFWTQDIAP